MVDKPFNLIRSYAITSLIVMLFIGGLSATLFSSYLADSLIRRDAIVSQAFLQSLTEVEGGAELFRGEKLTDSIRSPEQTYGLPELVDHIATMPGVVRANLYSNKGKVLWSTQADLKGKHFAVWGLSFKPHCESERLHFRCDTIVSPACLRRCC